jgi:hypothetical protein
MFLSTQFYFYIAQIITLHLHKREGCRLKVFENKVLRKIFWPEKKEVIGKWRKQHEEEHRDLYSSPNIVRMIK